MTRAARPSTITLNTSHPLYAKLVEFWYVATAGDTKMTGVKGTLDLNAAGTATTVTDGTHGAVALCDAADEAFSATALAAHKPTSGTWAAYWIPLETATQYVNVFGTSYDNALSSPYFCAGFYRDNAGGSTGSGITGLCSPGGSTTSMPVSPSSIAANYGVAITTLINCASGAQSLKIDNTSVGTASVAGSTSSTATSLVRVGGDNGASRNANLKMICCAIFTTPLDSTEQANFDTDPWGLVRPPPDPPTLTSATIAGLPAGTVGVFTTVSAGSLSSGDGTTTHVWTLKDHDGNVVSGATITLVWSAAVDLDGVAGDITINGHVHGWPTASTVTISIAADTVSDTNAAGTTGNGAITAQSVTLAATVANPYLASGSTYYFKVAAVVDGVESPLSNEDAGTFASGGDGGGSTPGRWRGRGRGRGRL